MSMSPTYLSSYSALNAEFAVSLDCNVDVAHGDVNVTKLFAPRISYRFLKATGVICLGLLSVMIVIVEKVQVKAMKYIFSQSLHEPS